MRIGRLMSMLVVLLLVMNVGVSSVVAAKVVQVNTVSVKASTTKVEVGKTLKLNAIVTPSNATNKKVTWSTNNRNVATVDTNGTVKGVSNGTAQITATAANGTKKASVVLTVWTPVTSVKLASGTLILSPKDVQLITASLLPGSASNKAVTWSSSNPAAVKVEVSTKTPLMAKLSAIALGTAVITVRTADGGKIAKMTVTVNNDKKDITTALNLFLELARKQDVAGMTANMNGGMNGAYYVAETYSMFPLLFVDRLKKNNENTTFEVKSISLSKDTAKVSVAAYYLDDTEYLGVIYSNALFYAVSKAESLGEDLSEEAYNLKVIELFKEGITNGMALNTGDGAVQLLGEESIFTVDFKRVNGIWKISDFDEGILNFMTCGLTGALVNGE